MKKYLSNLRLYIESFVQYRQACGCWNESCYGKNLRRFDHYCLKNYPYEQNLTQEMVNSWCTQRETEKKSSCINRTDVIVAFIKYLRERDLTDVSKPELPRAEKRTYIPHAFTNHELTAFFYECDHLPFSPCRRFINRRMTIPVLFRLLYSSGIRPVEVRLLKREHVDLEQGVLDIRDSKGNDPHYVVLHDSMLQLMKRYNDAIEKMYPGRNYFFPTDQNGSYSYQWIRSNFLKLWNKVSASRATVYGFRHHYAVANINSWGAEGFLFYSKLVYLGKSMGHVSMESTAYYYSLVPQVADILLEKTRKGMDDIIPEVGNEETNE